MKNSKQTSERSLVCKVECLSNIVTSKEHINGSGEAMGDDHWLCRYELFFVDKSEISV